MAYEPATSAITNGMYRGAMRYVGFAAGRCDTLPSIAEHYAGGPPWQSPSVPGAPCGRP
jgi:hypothetical protein